MADDEKRQAEVDAAIQEYLQAAESGRVVTREELLVRYANIADELRSYFEDSDFFDGSVAATVLSAEGDEEEESTFEDAPTRVLGPGSEVAAGAETSVRRGDVPARIGRYEIVREIGRGGMGIVYEARDRELEQRVALKTIIGGPLATQENHERFRREAKLIARMCHANIVRLYSYGTAHGVCYIAMELLEGRSLADRKSEFVNNPRKAAALVQKLAKAVAYAHQNGVVHRDIKPANILFDESDEPRLTDFGLAIPLDGSAPLTAPGTTLGTTAYMAPEQATSGVTEVVDVFSLGVILCELLLGENPFQHSNPVETLRRVNEVTPRFSSTVPQSLVAICQACLEKEPQRRYKGAAALAEDLQNFRSNRPVSVRVCAPCTLFLLWIRRRFWAACTLALTVFGLGVISLVWSWYSVQLGKENFAKTLSEERVEVLTRIAQRVLHTDHVAHAQHALRAERVAAAEDYLLRQLPEREEEDLRTFEWFHLWNRLHQEEWHHQLDVAPVHSLAFSHDGEEIFVGAGNSSLRVLDASSGRQIASLCEVGSVAATLDASSDGELLAVGNHDSRVRLWNVRTRKKIRSLEAHQGSVSAVRFSPDGALLITGSVDGTVFLWNPYEVSTPIALPTHNRGISTIRFSANGSLIAIGDVDGSITVWDRCRARPRVRLHSAFGEVRGIAFRDEDRELVMSGISGRQLVWRTDTWEPVRERSIRARSITLAMEGLDDRTISYGGGTVLRLHDVTKGQRRVRILGHRAELTAIAIPHSGEFVASADEGGGIRLWFAPTLGESLHLDGHATTVGDGGISPDGKLLTTLSVDAVFSFWDIEPVRHRRRARLLRRVAAREIEPYVNGSLSRDGTRAAGALRTGGVDVYRFERHGDRITETREGRLVGIALPVTGLAFSDDSKRLAVAANREVVVWTRNRHGDEIVWGIESRATAKLEWVQLIAFSRDGAHLALGSRRDGSESKIELLSVDGSRESPTLRHEGRTISVAFSPDSKRLAVGQSPKGVIIWDISDEPRELARLNDLMGPAEALTFSPGGEQLFVGTGTLRPGTDRRRTIHSFDLIPSADTAIALRRGEFQGHRGELRGLLFSPDGSALVSIGGTRDAEGEVTIWRAGPTRGQEMDAPHQVSP